MNLQDILDNLDVDTILIDSNGVEWTPDNIECDHKQYCIDGIGIWQLDKNNYRLSQPTYIREDSDE